MRRDEFTTEIDDDAEQPTLCVTYSGGDEGLRERLDTATDFDVTYRRTPPGEDSQGVLGVTDRMTGEFVFETPVDPALVQSLVEATRASEDGEDPRYVLRIDPDSGDIVATEQTTLLVYNSDGSLNRKASLIPGSVEI